MSRTQLELAVQVATTRADVPSASFIRRCVRLALPAAVGELVVRVVDEEESASLNERFRGKRGPTNVLAFPAGEIPLPDGEPVALGDIVICAPVVAAEAAAQGKPSLAHWAHLLVHGCLHLSGYDHDAEPAAGRMEQRERELLAEIGIPDPYREEE